MAESAIAPPENWRLKRLNIQLALRNKIPQLSAVGQRCLASEMWWSGDDNYELFLPKPLCMPEASGTLAKKTNPEPPPTQAYRINDFAKTVGIGRTTIYKLTADGKSAPSRSLDASLYPRRKLRALAGSAGAQMTWPQMGNPPARQQGNPGKVVGNETFHTIARAEPEADFVVISPSDLASAALIGINHLAQRFGLSRRTIHRICATGVICP